MYPHISKYEMALFHNLNSTNRYCTEPKPILPKYQRNLTYGTDYSFQRLKSFRFYVIGKKIQEKNHICLFITFNIYGLIQYKPYAVLVSGLVKKFS